MKLSKVKIENYRSIKNSEIILNNKTIILGRNNEGKSNIIKAIQLSTNLIDNYSSLSRFNGFNLKERVPFSLLRQIDFDFQRDIEQSIVKAKKSTRFAMISSTYNLNDDEILKLNNLLVTKTKTDGVINVEFKFFPEEEIEVRIRIKENGNAIRNKNNMLTVLSLISENYKVNFIPSIRTAESAIKIVRNLMYEDLKNLDYDDDYRLAFRTIEKIQQDRMDNMADALQTKLSNYVPGIKSLKIISNRPNRLRAMNNSYDLIIDDGVETMLEDKGDGIISLVAISLLHLSDSHIRDGLIIIDEPEAHLHSGAISELKNTLEDLSGNSQLVISTHHQIFVDREKIGNNYIIKDGIVKKAENIRKIRNSLGVNMSENLYNAEHIILVEGETDKNFLLKYINLGRSDILELIKNNRVALVKIGGVKNLISQLTMYNNCLCKLTVFLDNDNASKKKVDIAIDERLINQRDLYLTNSLSKKESEMEDLLNDEILIETIKSMYEFDVTDRLSISEQKKFSDRVTDILRSYGKLIDSKQLNKIKMNMSDKISKQESINFINDQSIGILNAMLDNVINSIKK